MRGRRSDAPPFSFISLLRVCRSASSRTTCPVYRDTDSGRKSGFWLADDPAKRRALRRQSPTKPDWNFAVLVGKPAADQTPFCGGVTLDPVRVSVLPQQRCEAAMLPAENFRAASSFCRSVRSLRFTSCAKPQRRLS
jgi:hypothetical protein